MNTAAVRPNGPASSRGAYLLEMEFALSFDAPFHVGTGERLSVRTDAPVLRDPQGRLWLPGSSVRGVIRDWCEREAALLGVPRSALVRLFGSIPEPRRPEAARDDRQGRLQVHDVELSASQGAAVRDHVRLDPRLGAGADGGKFDREVGHAATGTLRLVYEGDSAQDPEVKLLRSVEAALRDGLLAFGAHSGSGLGRVRLTEDGAVPVAVTELTRSEPLDLGRYLLGRLDPGKAVRNGSFPGEIGGIEPRRRDRDEPVAWSWLRLRMRLQFDGPMLVAGPYSGDDTSSPEFKADATYQVDALARPLLPGASLRGALRHHALRVAATAGAADLIDVLFGAIARRRRADDRVRRSDTNEPEGRRGIVSIGEGQLVGEARTVVLNHVAIDRITGFAADQRLFSATALASPAFATDVLIRWNDDADDERAAVALFLFAVRDMEAGLGWVGSRTSRGYGHLHSVSIVEGVFSRVAYLGERMWRRDPAVRVGTGRVSDLQSVAEPLVAAWRARIGVTG